MEYVKCERCGTEMEPIDEDTLECPHCGCQIWLVGLEPRFVTVEQLEEMSDGEYDDIWTDDRPEVCTGCGSDMYPDCSYSCKLMNN